MIDPRRPETDPGPTEEDRAPSTVQYKAVETSDVTTEELERLLNEITKQGWDFDAMQFAMRESSRWPSMMFSVLTSEDEADRKYHDGGARIASKGASDEIGRRLLAEPEARKLYQAFRSPEIRWAIRNRSCRVGSLPISLLPHQARRKKKRAE